MIIITASLTNKQVTANQVCSGNKLFTSYPISFIWHGAGGFMLHVRNGVVCINCNAEDHSVPGITYVGSCKHTHCKLVVLVNGHIKSVTVHLVFSDCAQDRNTLFPSAKALWFVTVSGSVQYTYAMGTFKTE